MLAEANSDHSTPSPDAEPVAKAYSAYELGQTSCQEVLALGYDKLPSKHAKMTKAQSEA